jgi:hypothetical protein
MNSGNSFCKMVSEKCGLLGEHFVFGDGDILGVTSGWQEPPSSMVLLYL